MCLPKPKVPDQQPQIDESRRQFEAEQARLAEQEAARAAEAERQRQIEEERYAQQLAAEEAQRAREEAAAAAKQQAIDEATGAVNSGFAGFDDGYFDSFTQDYLGYYTPKIEQSAADARREAQFELARRGTLDSTAAAGVYERLAQKQAEEQARIAREAAQAANNLRSSVNTSRTNLLEQAVNSGGQGDFISLAEEAAGGIQPAAFQPLGDVFGDIMADGAAGGAQQKTNERATLTAPISGAANTRVVQPQMRRPAAPTVPAGLIF